MVPILSIVGYSDAGKTTLIEKLIPVLKGRGYQVGTVKHAAHEPSFDTEGKDSWRHYAAGADAVAVSSDKIIAMIRRKQETSKDAQEELSRMAVYFSDMDLVLAEGYKQAPFPKIEIFRNTEAEAPVCALDRQLIALVSDIDMPVPVPRFGLDDIEKLVDFIQEKYLSKPGR
jgi:molybdopterin-guanine dinucleotide biosynthesis adapter protein